MIRGCLYVFMQRNIVVLKGGIIFETLLVFVIT